MSRISATACSHEKGEEIVEAGRELGDARMPEPRRRQLDRERDPVDRAADGDDVGAARPVQDEARLGELRPVDEELHGIGAGASRRLAREERIGQGERRHAPNEFALDVERFAAGRE